MPGWFGDVLWIVLFFGVVFAFIEIRDRIAKRAESDRKRRLGETEDQ